MKKTLVLTTIALLVSGSAAAKTWVLTNAEEGMDKGNWQINRDQLKVKDHAFSIEQKVLHGGKQEGSKILTIHSKDGLTITLSPTRGMNLLRIEGFGSRMGWDSPVKEVVNPAFINLESRNGLGWLEGFNEMMVRCGYEWTGHPVTADGQIYTLHGKAGNTPASLGDMLYSGPNSTTPVRVHGAFVRDQEVHAVVQDWKARGRPQYVDGITSDSESEGGGGGFDGGEELDPLFDQAVNFVTEKRKASISGVQRQFRIGYNRAARIIEQMEAQGIVSEQGHNGNREVLAPPPFE